MNAVTWADLRLLVAARRRLVAAALVGLSVLTGLAALRPPAPPTVVVLAAARDLVPGAALALDDVASVALPAAAAPSGALRPGAAVLGRVVAGPVRRGEPLTDVRLVGPSLLSSVPGAVAVPVRLADPGAAALLRPGDRIDVLAAPPPLAPHAAAPRAPAAAGASGPAGAAGAAGVATAAARVVAANVLVLAVPGAAGLGTEGTLVVVACPPDVARVLAATAERLSPALLPPSPAAPPPPAAPRSPAAPRPSAAPPSSAAPTAAPTSRGAPSPTPEAPP